MQERRLEKVAKAMVVVVVGVLKDMTKL